MGLKHLSIDEKIKRVKLALEYIESNDELKKLNREISALEKQLKFLRKKDRKSRECRHCGVVLYVKKRRRKNLLKKHEKISLDFCLECDIDFKADEIEKREKAHKILFDNKRIYVKVKGGWAEKTFNKIRKKIQLRSQN